MTPRIISAVSFSNILNMNDKRIRELISTALTLIFALSIQLAVVLFASKHDSLGVEAGNVKVL